MVGHGGCSADSYLADPTSPIPSHYAVITLFKTVPVHRYINCRSWILYLSLPGITCSINMLFSTYIYYVIDGRIAQLFYALKSVVRNHLRGKIGFSRQLGLLAIWIPLRICTCMEFDIGALAAPVISPAGSLYLDGKNSVCHQRNDGQQCWKYLL